MKKYCLSSSQKYTNPTPQKKPHTPQNKQQQTK